MRKYKKNCPNTVFQKKLFPDQEFIEYNYALNYENKEDLSFNNSFEIQSIDDYFTCIQLLSNVILLKKYSYRSKESNCCYYELYLKDILKEEDFEKIENLREKRNQIHYDPYQAMMLSKEEIIEYVNLSRDIIRILKEIYGGK